MASAPVATSNSLRVRDGWEGEVVERGESETVRSSPGLLSLSGLSGNRVYCGGGGNGGMIVGATSEVVRKERKGRQRGFKRVLPRSQHHSFDRK